MGTGTMMLSKVQHERLVAKARAHDDYLEALKHVRRTRARLAAAKVPTDSQSGWDSYVHGYEQALIDLGEELVNILRNRMIEAGQ